MSKEEIYDHRKTKFLKIGRDQGFNKSSNLKNSGLNYQRTNFQNIKENLKKYSLIYLGVSLILIAGLLATFFNSVAKKQLNTFLFEVLTFKQQIYLSLRVSNLLTKVNNKVRKVKMSTLKGKVKWFNGTKGYGFIEREDKEKDVFVHSSAVREAGLKYLNEGDELTFEVESTEKGLRVKLQKTS